MWYKGPLEGGQTVVWYKITVLGGKDCGHFTVFKTGYLLTKITWLNSKWISLQRLQVYC